MGSYCVTVLPPHRHCPGAHEHLPPDEHLQHVHVPALHVHLPPDEQLHEPADADADVDAHVHVPGAHVHLPPVVHVHLPVAAASAAPRRGPWG